MKEILQKLAFNCLDLALLVKQCHWNVRGVGFKPLHDFLDIVFDQLIDCADDVSERMVTLDMPASGDVADISKSSVFEEIDVDFIQTSAVVDELTDRLKQLVKLFYSAIEEVGLIEKDKVTENMLQDMTQKLDKLLWMLRSQADKTVTPSPLAERLKD